MEIVKMFNSYSITWLKKTVPLKLNCNLGWGMTHGTGGISDYLKEAEVQIVEYWDTSCPVRDHQFDLVFSQMKNYSIILETSENIPNSKQFDVETEILNIWPSEKIRFK